MPLPNIAAFDAEVAHALRALGASPSDCVLDPLSDPMGTAIALQTWLDTNSDSELLFRVAPKLDIASLPSAEPAAYGPVPADLFWLRITNASNSLKLSPLRLAADGRAEICRAHQVVMEQSDFACCDTPGCTRQRYRVTTWLVVKPEDSNSPDRRLLVTEIQDLDTHSVDRLSTTIATLLARALQVSVHSSTKNSETMMDLPEEASPAVSAAVVARFAIRTEGQPWVIRDYASVGPRTSASRNLGIGFVLLAIALLFWFQTFQYVSKASVGLAVGLGSAAILFSLAGYAFIGVARFSTRYVARSTPIVWFCRDRFVVAPWVNRVGAIDLRPEGRLGAAIAIGELHNQRVHARAGQWIIELSTDHGTLEVLRTEHEAIARYWNNVIARVVASVRHPGAPSAKQRFRTRAQANDDA